MKIVKLVFVLVIVILAVIFAAQNSSIVNISFFSWSAAGSFSLILILTLTLGILVGVIIMAPSVFKRWFQSSGLQRKLNRLENQKRSEKKLSKKAAEPEEDKQPDITEEES